MSGYVRLRSCMYASAYLFSFKLSKKLVITKICYKISREKFEPEPGFEPRSSRFLARRSTTWAILVLMPAHVQISLTNYEFVFN